MATLRRRCAPVPQLSELRFGVVRAVGWGIALLDGGPRRARGSLGFLFPLFTMGNAIGSPMVKFFRFVCENFTMFSFGKRIVGMLDSWASGGLFGFNIAVGVYEKLANE